MFKFFKKIFSRKYVKHTFWKGSMDVSELNEIFSMCSLLDFEVCFYKITKRGWSGYNITVWCKKKKGKK